MFGTSKPRDLQLEDTALFDSVQTALSTKQITEKANLMAVRSVRGLQLPSVFEAIVSGAPNEVIYLLNGHTTASKIGSHALKESMFEKHDEVNTTFG